jgi:peptide methionine sulfoxide reductase MsrA
MSFDQILERIWLCHNPCSSAFSRQYMSAIFYDGEAQKKAILASKARMEEKLESP